MHNRFQTEMLTLDQMKPGDRARVVELAGDDAITVRLLEMGLLAGEVVEFLGRAPLGDPLTIFLRGGRLAVRSREAARVLVQKLDA